MPGPRTNEFSPQTALLIAGLLAVSIQIQATLEIFGQPTRFSASDLVIAFLAAFCVLNVLFWGQQPPLWPGKWVAILIAAMTGVLLTGFAVGVIETGVVSSWALQNRIVGWVLLLAHFFCGALLRASGGPAATTAYLATFAISGALIAAAGIVSSLLVNAGAVQSTIVFDAQMQGFIDNPNAFGVLAILGLCAAAAAIRASAALRGVLFSAWFCAGYLTFSRAAWLAGVTATVILVILRKITWKFALLWGVAPTAVLVGLLSVGSVGKVTSYKLRFVSPSTETKPIDAGFREHIRLAQAAIDLWSAGPILGAGLGTHWHRERQRTAERPQLLHSTPLWLLAETGLIGLAVFAGFGAYVLQVFRRNLSLNFDATNASVLLAFLIAFLAMCVFHDLLFQRVLWLTLGIAVPTATELRPLFANTAIDPRQS